MCRTCCGPTTGGFAHCFACRTLIAQLKAPLATVLPVAFCPVPSPLYQILLGYKESGVGELRLFCQHRIGKMLTDFAGDHEVCLFDGLGGPVDLMLPVPSTLRPPPSPLEKILGIVSIYGAVKGQASGMPFQPLRRTAEPIGHMRANADAFVVRPEQAVHVRGARIVLLDDTYVSGARSQSAAAALRRAGARNVLIVPLGRVIRPDKSAAHAEFARRYDGAHRSGRCLRCLR
jgi:hypothetical protein